MFWVFVYGSFIILLKGVRGKWRKLCALREHVKQKTNWRDCK